MPVKGSRGTRRHTSGPKHKVTKHYMQPYWPYLPMVFIILFGLLLGGFHPSRKGVLAYATDMTVSGLLQASNTQRVANGVAALGLNSKLDAAAQAKANDMVARNYWSHTTPDGQEPWVFIQNAGYTYTTAGENLAYGFATSSDTVTGWMNSAPHKANLLNGGFSEVGFGIANSPDYVSTGQETVVVAMYASPQVLSQSTVAPTPAPTSKPKAPAAPTPAPVAVAEQPAPEPPKTEAPKPAQPVTTQQAIQEPATLAVNRAQTLLGNQSPWVIFVLGMLSSLAILALLFKHSLELRHVMRRGERFMLKHPVFDTVMVSFVMIAYVFNSTSGFIR